jgi:ATP-dependent protease Clp ATPase subunit
MTIKEQCSFCGKPSVMVSWLAGESTRSPRICNECVGICLEVRKNSGLPFPTEAFPPDDTDRSDVPPNAHAFDWALLGNRVSSCSFCGRRQKKDLHMVAGPHVWICAFCVDEALARYEKVG